MSVVLIEPGPATTRDERGSDVHDWENAKRTTIRRARVAPGLAPEVAEHGREGADDPVTVYAPGVNVEAATIARLEINRVRYEIDGRSGLWARGRRPIGTVFAAHRFVG